MGRERLRVKVVEDLYVYVGSVTKDMDRGVKEEMLLTLVGIVGRMSIEDVVALTRVLRAIKPPE